MNIKEIKELVKMLDGTDIAEFTLESEGNRLMIKKGCLSNQANILPMISQGLTLPSMAMQNQAPVLANTPSTVETVNEGLDANQIMINAPMVGTFYRAPGPDTNPYIQVGQIVEIGQVLCIIEAMKLMNEIESELRGKVVNILVENAQSVEYGQPLFVLEKI